MITLPVTVVITVWKRSYLEQQLDALLRQTMLPAEIWIILYEDHIDIQPLIDRYKTAFPSLYMIRSDKNLKYFGRFSVVTHVESEYTWLLDDDIIPGRKWLEICHEKCGNLNAVVSCTGRIIPRNDFRPETGSSGDIGKYFIGDCHDNGQWNYCSEDTVVDFACNSYFIRTAWIRDFWSIWPVTFASGEDIHLSASLKIRNNIATVVPAQICEETSGNLKKEYGRDEHSSWLKPGFYETRETVLRNMIQQQGWQPILWS